MINDLAFPSRMQLRDGRWLTAENAELHDDRDGAAAAFAAEKRYDSRRFAESLICAAIVIALFSLAAYGFCGGLK